MRRFKAGLNCRLILSLSLCLSLSVSVSLALRSSPPLLPSLRERERIGEEGERRIVFFIFGKSLLSSSLPGS
uniref:Secreted protein n=1 Tax=Anguilla anguilla TaxID=7936 RepID=A0A0E9XBW2_ANGAN